MTDPGNVRIARGYKRPIASVEALADGFRLTLACGHAVTRERCRRGIRTAYCAECPPTIDRRGAAAGSLPPRIESKIERVTESGCWIWLGHVTRNGYGQASIGQRQPVAHRAVYEWLRGPIPAGLDLDHKCRVRCCVNPDHLEPVTRLENLARGTGVIAENVARPTCQLGHALVHRTRKSGRPYRLCLECAANRKRGDGKPLGAAQAHTCSCGLICRGNGGWAAHKRACAAHRATVLALAEREQEKRA
jgi:hypothetical protein